MESPVEQHPTPDIEILGQKINYPRSWRGVTVVIAIASLAAWVTYVALVESQPENLKTLGVITGTLEVDTSRNTVEQRQYFRFEFWTPSIETSNMLREYLANNPQRKLALEWQLHDPQTNDIAAKNVSFGERLVLDSAINGYRRYKVSGDGGSGLKEGWWWIVGVNQQYSEDLLNWFAKFYKEHWGISEEDKTYIEVTAITSAS